MDIVNCIYLHPIKHIQQLFKFIKNDKKLKANEVIIYLLRFNLELLKFKKKYKLIILILKNYKY